MKRIFFLLALILLTPLSVAAHKMTPADNAYRFSFKGIDGQTINLGDYAGKVVLIVNTASQCGFTPQYEGLQKLYQTYKDKGLVVLGVPSDNFGGQEPGDETQIKQFTHNQFHVSFPLTAKTDVVGKHAHPFYDWAASQEHSGLLGARPRWNFHKFLIGRYGTLEGSYVSTVSPTGDTIISAVETALKK